METQVKEEGKKAMTKNKEMQDEMVGVLTAISIVSKRLATRLLQQDEDKPTEQLNREGELNHE